MTDADGRYRIIKITLDEASIARRGPEIEQEREAAIFDILAENRFQPDGSPGGPYHLHLAVTDNRLHLQIHTEDEANHRVVILSLMPFRGFVRDYFIICESYYDALKSASPEQLEAIDMGRRSLHNEEAQRLIERLKGKVEVDFDTARRLLTLICVLHIKV